MNNNVNIRLLNGLGDKLLDLIGFCVLCNHLNYNPHITFCNDRYFAWGNSNYDIRLFDFSDITISNDNCDFYLHSPNPSSSLCPYKVYHFISGFIPTISFETISNDFVVYAKKIIKPSEIILSNIPYDIENAYGIHLRKSDKINQHCDIRHENSINDFEIITNKLLEDVKNIIMNDDDAKFLIVSEDNQWKKEISDIITDFANQNNKTIKLIDIEYNNENGYCNYNSVLDMFCLSKCKEILQGVKYSTFSILASLLGNNKLRNYSNYINSYNVCLIHSWSSVVEINNNKIFDIELHKRITCGVTPINTNINTIFI
jgi:hypothetical protein